MATIIVLKNKETGEKRSMYSPDAREVLNGPEKEKWEFVRRLGRTAKMVETGVATASAGTSDGAVEFHGDRVLQDDARRSVEPAPADPVAESKTELPEAPKGTRGGGKQEPAKAKDDE